MREKSDWVKKNKGKITISRGIVAAVPRSPPGEVCLHPGLTWSSLRHMLAKGCHQKMLLTCTGGVDACNYHTRTDITLLAACSLRKVSAHEDISRSFSHADGRNKGKTLSAMRHFLREVTLESDILPPKMAHFSSLCASNDTSQKKKKNVFPLRSTVK